MEIVIIAVSTIIALAMVFSILNDPRGNQWEQILKQLELINAEIRSLKQKREELLKEIGILKIETSKFKDVLEEFDSGMLGFKDEMLVFRDQVSDTREKQIQLRETLSMKRPIIKVTGPLQVRNVEPGPKKMNNKLGKGIKSLLKEV
jgi:chromosome segregation ATPase